MCLIAWHFLTLMAEGQVLEVFFHIWSLEQSVYRVNLGGVYSIVLVSSRALVAMLKVLIRNDH